MSSLDVEKLFSDWEEIQEGQEAALIGLSTELKELKTDVREMLNLMRLVGAFFRKPVFGTVEENPEKEFEKRLGAILEKHGIPR
jgi:hypothetical protein